MNDDDLRWLLWRCALITTITLTIFWTVALILTAIFK